MTIYHIYCPFLKLPPTKGNCEKIQNVGNFNLKGFQLNVFGDVTESGQFSGTISKWISRFYKVYSTASCIEWRFQ